MGNAYVLSNNDHPAHGPVLYSELLSKDNDIHSDLPTGQTSPTTSEPNVVYGNIVQSQEPVLGNENVPPNNDTVLYSELQGKDNDVHKAAPSSDLYAEVQK